MLSLAPWGEASGCHRHASPAEIGEDKAVGADLRAQAEAYHRRPACHGWALPADPPADAGEEAGYLALAAWQDGRCAGCGQERQLVTDHDHETGMTRGFLCRQCNTLEPGSAASSTLGMYRVNPPVALLGLTPWPYYSPFTGYAKPAASSDD